MEKDDANRILTHRVRKHFAWMNDAECQAPFGNGSLFHHCVLGIKKRHLENLMLHIAECGMKMLEEIGARQQAWPVERRTAINCLPSSTAALSCAAFAGPTP